MTAAFGRDLRIHFAAEIRAGWVCAGLASASALNPWHQCSPRFPTSKHGSPISRDSKNGRKDQDSGAPIVNDRTMLRTPGTFGSGSTVGRLRRGLNPELGRRAVGVMARDACFSRRQFHRLTVQALGETPGAHQRRLRLDRGALLLLNSRATILEIALETGWESHETFTRAFRTRFRVTPSAFRKDRGSALPQSLRAGFSIATYAAVRSTGSGRA